MLYIAYCAPNKTAKLTPVWHGDDETDPHANLAHATERAQTNAAARDQQGKLAYGPYWCVKAGGKLVASSEDKPKTE